MPELMSYDRLLPCLLDRLTDEEPRSGKESRDRRVMTLRRYLDGVRRDLNWLLNSKAHAPAENITEYPEVAQSVLNFGIPDLCGSTGSAVGVTHFEREVRRVLQVFEPRIVRNTLAVEVGADSEEHGPNGLTFEISGELWAQPVPESFFVKTEVDLETGDWIL